MAAFDYSGLASTATALIEKFGAAITLERDARAVPPGEPWLSQQGTTAAAPAQSISSTGVQVSLEQSQRDGDVQTANEAVFLVLADSALPEQMGTDWRLVRDGVQYEVQRSRPLKPGSTLLLYKVVVAV